MDYFEQIGITQLIGFPSADAENFSDLVYGISPLSWVDSGFMSDCKDLLSFVTNRRLMTCAHISALPFSTAIGLDRVHQCRFIQCDFIITGSYPRSNLAAD